MESTPLAPKPKSSVPSRLTNGNPHPAKRSDRTSIAAKERERLNASILSSNKRRRLVDHLDRSDGDGDDDHHNASLPRRTSDLEVDARDPRDEAHASVINSRQASPYTLNPPVDFDGLSWPSKQ